MKEIGDLNKNKNVPSAQIFYRGQEAHFWEVKPSVFRDNMLSVEHNLMQEPLRQIPNEFRGIGDSFARMEKYQHYGLCTRLLDVTTNPLVALYFACAPHCEEIYEKIDEDGTEMKSPQGIIYFKEENMPVMYNELSVSVISKLASYNMDAGVEVREIIQRLYEDAIISQEQKESWLTEKGLMDFITICQGVYTVMPILNNDRLIRQSGAFLLPGKFNFSVRNNSVLDTYISKGECSLREEFDRKFFYIENDNKEKIREELEHCNISEANLFPELEYQLKHIRRANEVNRRLVAYFEKFQMQEKDEDVVSKTVEFNSLKAKSVIDSYIVDIGLQEKILIVLEQCIDVDWIKRDSVISKIRVVLCKELIKSGMEKTKANSLAEKMTNDIIEEHRKG